MKIDGCLFVLSGHGFYHGRHIQKNIGVGWVGRFDVAGKRLSEGVYVKIRRRIQIFQWV
jgi:hypothetical protein